MSVVLPVWITSRFELEARFPLFLLSSTLLVACATGTAVNSPPITEYELQDIPERFVELAEEETLTAEEDLAADLDGDEGEDPPTIKDKDEAAKNITYKQRTEIDFEDIDIEGELVKPQGALLLDRKRSEFGSAAVSGRSTSAGTATGIGGLGTRSAGAAAGLGGGGTKSAGAGEGLGSLGGLIGTKSAEGGSGYGRGAAPQTQTMDLPPAQNNEDYENYGINAFVLAAQDQLSTFAVDVDTASYTMVRRKLRQGYLPPASMARVEEFVNYFPYEYPNPPEAQPFTVAFEGAPSPWNPHNQLVSIGVQGRKVDYKQRKPVHLTFLVDVSGSMGSSDKLALVKKSLALLAEELEDGDTVAIATYAGGARVVLEPTDISHKAQILKALEDLRSGGSTAMASGIDNAYALAERTRRAGHVNRVIICSDGDANVGSTSHTEISAKIHGYAEQGITLTTLGFGQGNYKDTMMERLANDGDGNYFYIDSILEARRVLVDRMTSTLEVIAKDVKIQVDWDPEKVIAYRLVGYENRDVADRDFRNDAVDAGEIGAGHQVTALYELALVDGAMGELATVRVRNKAPGAEAPAVERSFSLTSRAMRTSLAETSAQFRVALAAASFAEILRGSPHVQELTLADVESMARRAHRAEYPEDAELVELIAAARALRGEAVAIRE